jgi:hypothetical protein
VRSAVTGVRLGLIGLALAGVFFYLLIVDLGISAGRIHHGVSVGGVEVGGLTEEEAGEVLERRVRLLGSAPVTFFGPGMWERVTPATVGWRPRPARSATAALRIGRANAPLGALSDRWRACFGGVDLRWAGSTSSRKMRLYVDRIDRRADDLGYDLDRPKLRRKIKRGINAWPRRPMRIPVQTD